MCFQEIEDKESLEVICNELNNPTLRRVTEFKQNSKEWNLTLLDHQTAILYDIRSGGTKMHNLINKDEIFTFCFF